ncbi:MAG: hypothetical protein P8Y63_13890, partial [Deltaproteobacteria bacterium]
MAILHIPCHHYWQGPPSFLKHGNPTIIVCCCRYSVIWQMMIENSGSGHSCRRLMQATGRYSRLCGRERLRQDTGV